MNESTDHSSNSRLVGGKSETMNGIKTLQNGNKQ